MKQKVYEILNNQGTLPAFQFGSLMNKFYSAYETKDGISRTYRPKEGGQILINDPNSDRPAMVRIFGHKADIERIVDMIESDLEVKLKLEE